MADKSLVISCADAGYIDLIHNFIRKELKPGSYFEIKYPGASLAFKTNEPGMINGVKTLLPFINTIYVIDHLNCAAYKKEYKDNDVNMRNHTDNMISTKKILSSILPKSVVVHYYFMTADGSTYLVDV
jgi:carbonic anhydrase